MAKTSKTVVISQGIASELETEVGVDPTRLIVIHNPVELASIQAQAKSTTVDIPESKFLLISVGRLAKVKNYPMLI